MTRKIRFCLVVAAGLLAGCIGPAVPNEHLTEACRAEPPFSREATIQTDVLLVADWVDVRAQPLSWENTFTVQPGYDPCARCLALLLRGFPTVEYLHVGAATTDSVDRYSLAEDGDPRCRYQKPSSHSTQSPPGKCVAVELGVPRSARYAIGLRSSGRDRYWIDRWYKEAVDLQDRRVIARAVELYQTGVETRMYACEDVGVRRGDADSFIQETLQPTRPATNG